MRFVQGKKLEELPAELFAGGGKKKGGKGAAAGGEGGSSGNAEAERNRNTASAEAAVIHMLGESCQEGLPKSKAAPGLPPIDAHRLPLP